MSVNILPALVGDPPSERRASLPLDQLVALASAVVHVEEARGPGGHVVDWTSFETALALARPTLEDLGAMALLPVKR